MSLPTKKSGRTHPIRIYIKPAAAMASVQEKETQVKAVQLEALVVMKVIKHCASRFPTVATGSLVGMDNNSGTLEVTNTFPFPVVDLPPEAQFDNQPQHFNAAASAPRAKANTAYQAEMIRMLREVNVDANNVGWYTSANLGNFVNANFIENQYHYQKELNEKTVALVHDVSRSSQGILSIRAFRLSPQFMTAYKENKFTTDNLLKSGLKYSDILVEVPVSVHNSHLVTTFLHQVPRMLASGVMKLPALLTRSRITPLSRTTPSHHPSSHFRSPLTPTSLKHATTFLTALRPTMLKPTISRTIPALWPASRLRSSSGSRSARRRTRREHCRSSHLCQRMSGRNCSSYLPSRAVWRAC
ncbi:hypothetical protein CLAIMM_06741 [Cladophialophora immunda]|nr:hypothetical protein CLAIMM_06741 [Cladophialophora immunda]